MQITKSLLRAAALLTLLTAMISGGVHADVVTEWNSAALDFFKEQNTPNQFANRGLAMVHVAIFDAARGITGHYSHLIYDRRSIPPRLSVDAAVAAAAYTVLIGLYPNEQMRFEQLYHDQLARITSKPLTHAAILHGKRVGQEVLNARENDGSAEAGTVQYPDGTQLGEWRRTDARPPMLPGWGDVLPFTFLTSDQFRLVGPPSLTGYEYARDYNEVRLLGAANSQIRTMDQTAIARFWASGIPRLWNLVAQQLSAEKGYTLIENARLFALLNVALADANVAGWDMKYHYGFWRPITAIAYGDVDGNDQTPGDPSWSSLLPAPPFPEYISGHSISCAAAATILAKFAGDDSFTFTLTSEANSALPPRTYRGFWEAAREAGSSRIFGGIHFNFSNVEGLEAGRSLARYIFENYLAPMD